MMLPEQIAEGKRRAQGWLEQRKKASAGEREQYSVGKGRLSMRCFPEGFSVMISLTLIPHFPAA
jgi:hypothetical protein